MRPDPRAPRLWWLAGALLLPWGCGGPARPVDPAQAESALRAALDAWKAGETPGDLARRAAPIHVADADWGAGRRLLGYSIADAGRPAGYDRSYPVVLELQGPKGKPLKKSAVYSVTTGPKTLVVRQEG